MNPPDDVMNVAPPFILQYGDERKTIKAQGRLIIKRVLRELYDNDDPFSPAITPLVCVRQDMRFFIGDDLIYTGSVPDTQPYGQYIQPDKGLPEIHFDPRYVRAA